MRYIKLILALAAVLARGQEAEAEDLDEQQLQED